jgi:tetratricopeptide (TPR) repeat protein
MTRRLTGVVIALIVITLALTALDKALAKVESAELHSTAQRSYLAGTRLLAAGKAGEAIDLLRQAHSVERENPDYELALITAFIDSGRTADAEPLMNEMLQRVPNDGHVNLIAARLRVREGNDADAEPYYHRAIYGEWPDDPAGHRIAARMELIDDLTKRGELTKRGLAELVSLDAEPAAGVDVRKRLARLFFLAGSPARAADIYREMAAKDPKDIAAYEGLGEAELEQGQYNAARAAFSQAFFQSPNNASIQSHLQILNTVVALDPELRKLTSEEKYRRSIHILDMARTGLSQCAAKNSQAGTDESARLMSTAAAAISSRGPAHVTNEAAESVLALAEAVWRARNQACNASSEEEDVLNLLMKKLAS